MAFVFAYIKPGEGCYDDSNYPGHVAKNCDWEHAVHLALSRDGVRYTPLRNNTGVLFARGTFDEGPHEGTTKTLIDPWIFRMQDGTFGVLAVRRNQNAPDPLTEGSIMLFRSRDLVFYEESGFLKVAEGTVRRPRCRAEGDGFLVEWETEDGVYQGTTVRFGEISGIRPASERAIGGDGSCHGVPDAVPGNVIEVTEEEARRMEAYLGVIENTGVAPLALEVPRGTRVTADMLPKATCLYSDGSTHDKAVRWDPDEVAALDPDAPGTYRLHGEIRCKIWPFPMPLSERPGAGPRGRGNMSDPAVVFHEGRYYLTSSGGQDIVLRAADRLEDVFTAEPVVVHRVADVPGAQRIGTWAAELHWIAGVPCILTARCLGPVSSVQAHVLRCLGDPEDPSAWEAPRLCVKPNGKPLTEGGISLDMTYFCVNGVHYVMWSDRKWPIVDGKDAPEPADIYIAAIDPEKPWQAVTEPQCVVRPMYGWDRYETEVDEGPYLLRRGDDLFISVSGSSTGMADLYDLGLLHAKAGSNLLDPAAWDWLPYPVLTKESVPGEYGPGHNSFVKDHETGDDMMVYHAVPHDENGKSLGRRPAVRRVHWAKTGLPYLEMTAERDLKPEFRSVVLELTVR